MFPRLIFTVLMLSAALAWSQPQADAKGLTWKLLATNVTTGTIDVGCWNGCNAYQGDTPCTTALPILCIKKTGPGFPPRPPRRVDLQVTIS